jgi:hypothetical protein
MNRRILSVLVGGVLSIALTVWLAYPSRPKSIRDISKAKYMHCPDCKREKMYAPSQLDQKCLYCDQPLVLTEESITKTGAPPNRFAPMMTLVFGELIVVMAGVWWAGRHRDRTEDEELLYINCEKCRQKIRYRLRQIGNKAMCPRCKRAFVYPEAEE